MQKALLLFTIQAILFTACSSDSAQDASKNSNESNYPVTTPLVVDTVISKEYVTDIQSLQNVEIRARVKGYIEKIYVDEGKEVQAGQILFTIGDNGYQQELLKAKALLKSAIAEARQIELEVKNKEILLEKNVISKTDLEISQAKLESANAKIEEARSDAAQAELNLSYTQIKAPFNGIINRIPNKTGSLIEDGTLLTTISNNKEIYAYFNFNESEYLDWISNNKNKFNTVNLILANNQLYPFSGIIETVEGEFDKTTGNIAFRAKFENPDNLLKHGSSGKIIIKSELKSALIIPQKSTFEIQENTYVFCIDKNNTVHMKPVKIKSRINNLYVIQSGLDPDDKLLFEGIQLVNDGDKINPTKISTEAAYTEFK